MTEGSVLRSPFAHYKPILLLLALFLVISACKNPSSNNNGGDGIEVRTRMVYVAGNIDGNAALWINGNVHYLASAGSADSMFALSGVVYVAGSRIRHEGDGAHVSTVWKVIGENSTVLYDLEDNCWYNSLVSNYKGDIYVMNQGNSYIGKIWKNGKFLYNHGLRTTNAEALSMSVFSTLAGDDVYVAGTIPHPEYNNTRLGVLWKNGDILYVWDGYYTAANAVAADDYRNVIHVAGYFEDGGGVEWVNYRRICWHHPPDGVATHIFYDYWKGNLYLAGQSTDDFKLTVWKYIGTVDGNHMYHTRKIEEMGYVRSIFVYDDDVYVAGTYYDSDGFVRNGLWKNGILEVQDLGLVNVSSVTAFTMSVYHK